MKRFLPIMAVLALSIIGGALVVSLWAPTIMAENVDWQWIQEQSETRTAQSVETIIASPGLTATYTAIITDGISFSNDGATFLHVKNGAASTMTITVQSQITVDGLAVADLAVEVGASEERFIGPFPTTTYNVQSGTDINKVYVTPSSYDASLTMAILTL